MSVINNYFECQLDGNYGIIFNGVDTGIIENNTFNGFRSATLIYLGDSGGISCNNISIGPNRHSQSGGLISNLVAATSGSTDCFIRGKQYTTGAITTISGPFRYWGNIVFPSGSGIDFSASSNAAGMTSEVLDDYEHGTFTPGLSFGGGTSGITYVAGYTNGRYSKIGNRVFFSGLLVLSNKGSSTGDALLTGLPFTAANSLDNNPAVTIALRNTTFAGVFQALVNHNTTTVSFQQINTAGTTTNLNNSNFSNDSTIYFSGHYVA